MGRRVGNTGDEIEGRVLNMEPRIQADKFPPRQHWVRCIVMATTSCHGPHGHARHLRRRLILASSSESSLASPEASLHLNPAPLQRLAQWLDLGLEKALERVSQEMQTGNCLHVCPTIHLLTYPSFLPSFLPSFSCFDAFFLLVFLASLLAVSLPTFLFFFFSLSFSPSVHLSVGVRQSICQSFRLSIYLPAYLWLLSAMFCSTLPLPA